MQLKQLEIKGFKSFADKTIIHFNQAITGIVGPNGCGKSNIVDAIRWVLGEQSSKELRSDRMSSLIFNGSKIRRAAGLAEVCLTFLNDRGILRSEYHEVSISRILYRSGESEYRINQIPCRLKDIQHLFMDSGITADSYAIIALDMVDALLQDRDSSRRKLFEQAAGISSYKLRKKETQSRLALTIQDLERAEDLMFEMQDNLKSLEKQAKRAKSYFKLKKKYNRLSVYRATLLMQTGKTQLENLNQQWDILREEISGRQANIHLQEAGTESLKLDLLKAESILKQQETALHELKTAIQSKEQEAKHTRQFIDQGNQRQQELTSLLKYGKAIQSEYRQKSEMLREKYSTYQALEKEAETAWTALKADKDQATEKLALVRKNESLVLAELNERRRKYQKLEQELTGLQSQLEERQRQLQQAATESEQSQEQKDRWQKEIEQLTATQKTHEANISDFKRQQQALETQLELFAKETERLKEQNLQIKSEITSLENERRLTLNYIESLDGYTDAVKHIRRNYKFNKPAPFLSDILDCLPEYKLAIESYLRPWMEYFIVETRQEAIDLINWLHQTGKGKASIFVLEKIKSKAILPMQSGVSNALSTLDLVSCESMYHPLIRQLLSHVWVADELVETDPHITLITKDGRFVQNAMDISGGAVGLFEGRRIGGRQNIEKIDLRIESLKQKVSALTLSLNELDDKSRNIKNRFLLDAIHKETLQLEKANRMLIQLQSYLQEHNRRQQAWLQKLETENARMTEGKEKIAIQRKEKENLLKAINQLQSEHEQTEKALRTAQQAAENISKIYNEAHIRYIQQQNEVKSIGQELEFAGKQEQQFEKQQQQASNELSQLNENLLKKLSQIEQLEAQHLEDCHRRDKLKVVMQTLESEYFDNRQQLEAINEKIKSENRELAKLSELKAEIQSRREVVKHELNHLLQQFNADEFSDEDVPDEEILARQDPAELEIEWEKAGDKLRHFGEVNMLAVDAFDSLHEKYDSMLQQKQDILDAKVLLDKTIQEIEQTATERFMEAFTQTRQHFQEVFRTLFNEGDNCDLLLEQPNNPLESQILIIARPKGKKPLHINQLSGGEKTLTAIALLFSLYLLKPAPFCIFDEVDAPLDDANVLKFNQTIREFSNRSQFIIVTHNKLTMAEVDIIYGITMAEQGVSSVVPVNFSTLSKPEYLISDN
jgi:chromosome segregation protein